LAENAWRLLPVVLHIVDFAAKLQAPGTALPGSVVVELIGVGAGETEAPEAGRVNGTRTAEAGNAGDDEVRQLTVLAVDAEGGLGDTGDEADALIAKSGLVDQGRAEYVRVSESEIVRS